MTSPKGLDTGIAGFVNSTLRTSPPPHLEWITVVADMLAHATRFEFHPDFSEFADVFTDNPEAGYAVFLEYLRPQGRWRIRHADDCWSTAANKFVESARWQQPEDAWLFTFADGYALIPAALTYQQDRYGPYLRHLAEQIRQEQEGSDSDTAEVPDRHD